MIPTIAIVGRPNVGKSTLFNCLTRSRDALVADMPGVTRDRIYGTGDSEGKHFIVIDTGGVIGSDEGITGLTEHQSELAMEEADKILLIVDARAGLHPVDEMIARQLRQMHKEVWIVVNKSDGVDMDSVSPEFYKLGFKSVLSISASNNRGIHTLLEAVLADVPANNLEDPDADKGRIRVAVVGRPNVGKSTLINRLLGEERVLAHDMPGTTRDSIFVPFEYRDTQYTLIDTAGIRRRSRVDELIEKFSVVKSLQAIKVAQVIIYVISAQDNVSDQDAKLLGTILKEGKALIIAINKWDGLSPYQREQVRKEVDRRLNFIPFAAKEFISARHGTGVGDLMPLVNECYRSATCEMSTGELTRLLEVALEEHQPPMVKGRRVKLRYAHSGGLNPPTIIIHGNQVERLPESYRRYLENFYREKYNLVGTPIRILLRQGENPYSN